ncbi:MAG: response regulator [Chloroflexia bacterium]
MLVEDNPADAKLVRVALEEHAVSCHLVLIDNGERAIEFIDSIDAGELPCPDLAIVDLNLPRLPGTDVLSRILGNPRWKSTKVVILTSSDNQRDRDSARAIGVRHYFKKPSRLAEFMALGAAFKELLLKAH